MPYLIDSVQPLEVTEFPRALGADTYWHVKQIEELFRRHYPTVAYHALEAATAPATGDRFGEFPASEGDLGEAFVSGSTGGENPNWQIIDVFPAFDGLSGVNKPRVTQFDPLWGESVDQRMQLESEGWTQPHRNPDMEAANTSSRVEQHSGPFFVHAQVVRRPKEQELKKLGFDQFRDLLVHIPLSILDRYGITVRRGDWFVWDDTRYEVLQFNKTGWQRNSNVRFYMTLNCAHKRSGS